MDKLSFEIDTNSNNLKSGTADLKTYLPAVAFGVLYFFSNLGVTSIPNMMISEVFPFKLVDSFIFVFKFFHGTAFV